MLSFDPLAQMGKNVYTVPLPHNFPVPHISMFLHFHDYCKTKLPHLSVSNEVCFILQDILGSFLRGKQGLVDMSGVAELHDKFQSLHIEE